MTIKTNKIAGFHESQSGRWYVTEDRNWKVRINDENDATAIYKSRDMYRLTGDTVRNVRERTALSPQVPTHQEVVTLVAEVRSIES